MENIHKGMVVVTGAASGIGAATSIALAQLGFHLCLVDRNPGALIGIEEECRKIGVNVLAISVDIGCQRAVEEISEKLVLEIEGIKLLGLVNCAGVGGWANFQDITIEQWDRILGTNLRGTFLVTRQLIPIFIKQQSGIVINVLSDSAEYGFPRRTAYCASKYGLVGFSNALREDLRRFQIRVSMLYCNRVDTNFNGNIPGKRLDALEPESIANAICFIITQSKNIEIREIKIATPRSPYGL